jgi:hypothetical protein
VTLDASRAISTPFDTENGPLATFSASSGAPFTRIATVRHSGASQFDFLQSR